MHKTTSTAVAVLAAALMWAPAASAQDVTVRIPGDLVAGITRAVNAATGAEVQRDLREALHDLTGSLHAVRADELRAAIRDAARGLAHARDAGWIPDQARTFTAKQTDRQTRTLRLGPSGQLTLENVVGDITVTAGAGPDITLTIVRESRGRTDADARAGLDRVQAETSEGRGRASVKTLYQNENHANYTVSVQYIVAAPAGTQVTARSVAGDIAISGVQGDLSVSTISGNVRIDHAGRLSDARTTAGDITVSNINSDGTVALDSTTGTVTATQVKARRLQIGTVSDSIIVADAACEAVDLHSLSGDIRITGALRPRGRYTAATHSGDVIITTDGRTGFEFDGSSFSGSMHSDFPLLTGGPAARARRNLRGTFGDGSAGVTVTTFSGDVTIKKKV